MTSKPERLLDLIAELLHTERPLTAGELHERLPGYPEDKDSFKRAFERDKRDLREMGVPIAVGSVPGTLPPEEGYRIDPDEYYLADPGLEPDELAALHFAASAVRLEGSDAGDGLRKLGAGPTPSSDVQATLRSAPNLAEVFEAVSQRRQLRFRYHDKDRVVDPVRLHHQKGRWYLQGHDHGVDDQRSFRLDRIEGPLHAGEAGSAAVDRATAETPLLLDGWAFGDDEPVEAVVRIDRAQARLAVRSMGDDVVTDWDRDGSVVLRFPVRRRDGLRTFVLGFLDAAEVLGPEELRADMVAWLAAIAGEDT